jgi:hypothetical protein
MAASSQAAARYGIGSVLLQREGVPRIPMLSCRLTQWGRLYRSFVWEVHSVLYPNARLVSAVPWSDPTINRVTAPSLTKFGVHRNNAWTRNEITADRLDMAVRMGRQSLGNRTVVKPKWWEDDIKVDLKETGGSGLFPVAGFWCCHISGVPWRIITGSGSDDWIYWHFFIITTAHSHWLPKTRSIPYWTTCVFSSTATDLVLIYESVIFSASVVRWLTFHSRTLDFLRILLRWNQSSLHSCFYSLARIRGKCLLLARIRGTFVDSVDMESAFRTKSVSTNPHPHRSHCLGIDYSGFQASCHIING